MAEPVPFESGDETPEPGRAEFLQLQAIDPRTIDNEVLANALRRLQDRATLHAGHTTKHTSHTSHGKGGVW